MKMEKRPVDWNVIVYYLRNACIVAGNYPIIGIILQVTLREKGLSPDQIGLVTSVMGAMQTASILLCSLLADKMKQIRRSSALSVAGMAVFGLLVTPFAGASLSSFAVIALYIAAGCVFQAICGVYTVLEYKLPYMIIDMRDYGRVSSVTGLVNGVLMIGVSGACMSLIARMGIARVSTGLYMASIACYLAGAALTMALKQCAHAPAEQKEEKAGLLETLRLKSFRWLLAPNLLRGFNSGVIGMMAVIGMHELGMDETQGSALSVALTTMSLVGCGAYLLLLRRFDSVTQYLMGSVIMLVFLPASLLGGRFAVFLACYVVVILGQMLGDYAVPVAICEIVPYRCIGSYTSLRMGAHTGGMALGTAVAGAWLGHFPAMALLIVSGAAQFASGLAYYMFCTRHESVLKTRA